MTEHDRESALTRELAALRRVEERYRSIVEHTSEGVLVVDADGRITFANRRFAEMLGRELDTLLGNLAFDFLDVDVRAGAVERLSRRREGIGEHYEQRFLHQDGSEVVARVHATPITSTNGTFEGVISLITDLTALRRTEAQLRQAQKMEAVGSLAGGVAHDFNNLLSVIISYASLALAELKPGEPLREYVEPIEHAGKRAAELTRQLLAFSRKQILSPQVVDLPQTVRSLEKILRRVLGEDIELSFLTDTRVGRILVDPSQLEQIIMNLVVNARDAMPEGGRLTIETNDVTLDEEYAAQHYGVTPGAYVMLAVTDTGVGMTQATLARIFEPFFTTKGPNKGTGLGLSTVFGIVKQSDGHIWVYSEPNQGTTFKIYFPVSERRASPPTQAPTPAANLRGSETILLVEDEEAVRSLVRSILRRQGYNVLDAQNGGEALLICEQYGAKIHLLLTDVVMPRMNGRVLADRLTKLRPELRVLYVSGYTENTIVHHGVLDAGIAYLPKPITPDALIRKVREVLDA